MKRHFFITVMAAAALMCAGRDVKVLTTTDDRLHDLEPGMVAFSTPKTDAPTITVKPATLLQEIDGFGAAITGSTAYNLMRMPEDRRREFLHETFSRNGGYGMSYVRVSIGCSDFSLDEYSCCDTPGIENFALTKEELMYVIPILQEIREINPEVKIMGSPWTPPRWMKVNNLKELRPHNEWTSGHINPKYYDDYAEYFLKWLEAFEDHGLDIYAITMQNEPLNRGNSASCFMGWEEQRDFLKGSLGPVLKKAGTKVKVYAFDHNYNYDSMKDQEGYPTNIYADEAGEYLAGAAYHNYGGNKDELLRIHNCAPEKELVFTETSIGTWNDGRNLGKRLIDDMNEIVIGTVNRWCRGAIAWNLMLDDDRGPNREGGCQTCYGAVDLSPDMTEVRRNSHYYIMAHASVAAQPGAHRIAHDSTGNTEGIETAAFLNNDGSRGLLLSNSTCNDREVNVIDGDMTFVCTIPARGIVTCRW
ncbi:MAG: glucosylceramidase [Muribaculaceae bacterium]|nr:glucosylceramidase [Muribaculaceae bacterium]